MYRVTIYNDSTGTIIHEPSVSPADPHLYTGTLTQGSSGEIDSLQFEILPNNPGYDLLESRTTMVQVMDVNTDTAIFTGRVLTITPQMEESGLVYKSVVCEDRLGFLCDSVQPYTPEATYTLEEFFDLLLANHNAQVEDYKKIYPGTVTASASASTGNVTKGLNYQTTWEALKEKLLDTEGGEVQLYTGTDGLLYLDYAAELGSTGTATIALGKNMQSVSREIDPTSVITRLIPLGAKLEDEDGVETEERLTIASVNDGVIYLDDEDAQAVYGIVEGTVEWDDVTEASNLLTKAQAWLEEQTVTDQITLTAVDLYLAGLEPEAIERYNYYLVTHDGIGLNTYYRVVKVVRDICNPTEITYEMGGQSKSLASVLTDASGKASSAAADATAAVNGQLAKTVTALIVSNATIRELQVSVAEIDDLTAEVASINSLLAGNIGTGTVQTVHLTADNVVIDDAVITSAMIASLTADKITSGTIYTNLVTIQSESGNLYIADNTIQIQDANSVVRVQIGEDATGDYNLYLWDGSGALIWDAQGLTEAGLTGNGAIIKDVAVADDANISGYKLDISSVATCLNADGSLVVDAAQVTIDNTTLDYKLTTITDNTEAATAAAEAAQAAAVAAQSTADDAAATAASAATDAATAQSTADAAKSAADTAQLAADTAQADATAAQSAADAAQAVADDAQAAADAAQAAADAIDIGARNYLVETATPVSKTTSSTSGYIAYGCYGTYNNAALSDLGFESGDWATLSFDWEITNATTYGNFRAEWGYGTKGGTYISAIKNPIATFSADNTSGHFEITVTLTTATIAATGFKIRIDNSALTLTISNAKLEKGNVATDWTPAPEDLQEAADAAQAVADAAQAAADAAQADADSAATAAATAQSAADAAQADATAAQSTADTAKANAATAQEAAEAAQSTADDAAAAAAELETRTTTLETELSVVQGQITAKVWQTDITEAISGISVGGRNLVLNSTGNLGDTSHWTGATLYTDGYNGHNALGRAVSGSTSSGRLFLQQTITSQIVGMAAGDAITISLWLWVDSGITVDGTNTTVQLRQYAAGSSGTYTDRIVAKITSSNVVYDTWTYYELSTTLPYDASDNTAYINLAVSYNGDYRISCLKVERGTIATDWTPAPEDTETAITTIQDQYATVTQTISGIETEIGDLTTVVGDNYSTLDSKITTVSETADSISATVSSNYTALSAADTKYGTCSTGASTKAKVVTCSSFTTLSAGATICVYFTYANTAASPTLNVNSTGAKTIYAYGAAIASDSDYNWVAKSYVTFVYNGSQWCMVDAGSHSKIATLQVTADSLTSRVSQTESDISDNAASITTLSSELTQLADSISLCVTTDADTGYLRLGAGEDGTVKFTVDTDNLTIDEDGNVSMAGKVTATSGTIGPWVINSNLLYTDVTIDSVDYRYYIQRATGGTDDTYSVFGIRDTTNDNWLYRVFYSGNVYAARVETSGNMVCNGTIYTGSRATTQIVGIQTVTVSSSTSVADGETWSATGTMTTVSGASYLLLPQRFGYGYCTAVSRSSTTITATVRNASGASHTCSGTVVVIAYI